MIEIVHATSQPHAPTPAKPILGHLLLDLESKQRTRFVERKGDDCVSMECKVVDDLLGGGGVERGVVLGMSCEGEEGRMLSLNTLSTVLLSHLESPVSSSSPIAAIIDTTGTFPLSLLARILKSRLETSKLSERTHIPVDEQVQRLLGYVSISRIFDVPGLWEVISEITAASPGEARSSSGAAMDEEEQEIPSSDASINSIIRRYVEPTRSDLESQIQIVIIDTLTPLLSALFATSEKSAAHDLLASLSRTLFTLSTSKNLITILHNGIVPSKPGFVSTNQAPKGGQRYENQGYGYHSQPQKPKDRDKDREKSIFEGNKVKPALGSLFSQFPNLHLFFSNLPRSVSDAENLYGQDRDSNPFTNTTPAAPFPAIVEYVTVLEILKDESPTSKLGLGAREQRWTTLEISKDGTSLLPVFQDKGTMRGMAMEREKRRMGEMGGLKDVGKFAKLQPGGFGGRRV